MDVPSEAQNADNMNEENIEGDREANEMPEDIEVRPVSETRPANEMRPANEIPLAPTAPETPRPVNEMPEVKKPRRKKSDKDIKKAQCGTCLREFNPAYLNRHICKPPQPPEAHPASETRPANQMPCRDDMAPPEILLVIEPAPPIPTIIERQVTAADVASFLKRDKDARRAEKVARYSAAMFGV